MEQAVKVSRFADDSGIEHGAKGIEKIQKPLFPMLYALCAMPNPRTEEIWQILQLHISRFVRYPDGNFYT